MSTSQPDHTNEREPGSDYSDRRTELSDDPEARELLRELAEVLRPEPLPAALVRRIQSDLAAQRVVGNARRWYRRWPAGLAAAAAAALLLAVIGPLSPQRAINTSHTPDVATLTPDEAAEIVAAYGVLDWEGLTDETLAQVAERLEALGRWVEGEQNPNSARPWGAEDDWDTPRTHADETGRGQTAPRWLAA